MQCMATAAAACGPYRSGVGVWGSPRIGEQCAPRGRPLGKLHGQSVRGLRGPHRHRDRRGWWRRRVVLPIAAQQAAQRMGATVFIGLRLPAAMALRADVRGPRWQLCLGHYRQRRERNRQHMQQPCAGQHGGNPPPLSAAYGRAVFHLVSVWLSAVGWGHCHVRSSRHAVRGAPRPLCGKVAPCSTTAPSPSTFSPPRRSTATTLR